jgi:hypothetical protein
MIPPQVQVYSSLHRINVPVSRPQILGRPIGRCGRIPSRRDALPAVNCWANLTTSLRGEDAGKDELLASCLSPLACIGASAISLIRLVHGPRKAVGVEAEESSTGRAVDDGQRLWPNGLGLWPNGTGLGDDRCRTNWEGWFDEFTGCADANEWLDNSVLLGCSDGQCVGARRGPRAHRVLDCPGNRARRGCGVGWSAGLGWVSCRADRCSRRPRTSIC